MKDVPAKVFVHVVTYNNETTIAPCLSAILKQDGFNLWENLFLYVTDNNSTDNTVEIINQQFSGQFRFKQNDLNIGFSKAHNDAISLALSFNVDFVLVLNPDLALEPSALKKLTTELLDDTRAGMCVPKLIRATDDLKPSAPLRYDATGMYITPSLRHFDRGSEELANPEYEVPCYTFGGSGAALLLRKSFIKDVALPQTNKTEDKTEVFDEEFFAYREDADLSWRAQWLGWKCRYVPEAIGFHKRVVTPEKRKELPAMINMLGVKNRFLLQLNNFSWRANINCIIPGMFRNIVVILGTILTEQSSIPGLKKAWQLTPSFLSRRLELKRRYRVSNSYIRRWFSSNPVTEPALNVAEKTHEIKKLLIVVINYNSGFRLNNCLRELSQQVPALNKRLKTSVVVTDNNSVDGSATRAFNIFSDLPNFSFIMSKENLGFAGAINKAVKNNPADAILILNPDVHIRKASIVSLIEALENYSQLGATSPVLLNPEGKTQLGYSAKTFPTLSATLAELFYLHRLFPNNSFTTSQRMLKDTFAIDYLTLQRPGRTLPYENRNRPLLVEQPAGAALMIDGKAFEKLSGFDEDFWPAWFEDVDFCKRLKDAGYLTAVVGKSTALHEGGYSKRTLSASDYANAWYSNMCRYWKKHGTKQEYIVFRTLLPLALLTRSIVTFFSEKTVTLPQTLLRLAISPNSRR